MIVNKIWNLNFLYVSIIDILLLVWFWPQANPYLVKGERWTWIHICLDTYICGKKFNAYPYVKFFIQNMLYWYSAISFKTWCLDNTGKNQCWAGIKIPYIHLIRFSQNNLQKLIEAEYQIFKNNLNQFSQIWEQSIIIWQFSQIDS